MINYYFTFSYDNHSKARTHIFMYDYYLRVSLLCLQVLALIFQLF